MQTILPFVKKVQILGIKSFLTNTFRNFLTKKSQFREKRAD